MIMELTRDRIVICANDEHSGNVKTSQKLPNTHLFCRLPIGDATSNRTPF